MNEAQLTEGIYRNIVRWHKRSKKGHVTLYMEDEGGKKYRTEATKIVDWIGNDIDRLTRFDLVVFNDRGMIYPVRSKTRSINLNVQVSLSRSQFFGFRPERG